MPTSLRAFAALAGICAAVITTFGATQRVLLSNARINPVNGLLQADILLTAPPLPRLNNVTGRVRVAFSVGDAEEVVDFPLSAVNVKRTVNSKRPFPCNETLPVMIKVVEPADVAGHMVTAHLTRKCTRSQGTPDLTVVSVVRTDRGLRKDAEYLQSPRETPIQVTVKLQNVAKYAMRFNEQGGTPWTVQVTPGTSSEGPFSGIRRLPLPLSAGQDHSIVVQPVALPCGRLSNVTVVVDRDNVILESNETNNRKTFRIPGNRCQDSDLD